MNQISSFCKFGILILFSLFVMFCNFSYGQTAEKADKMDTLTKPLAVKAKPPQFRTGLQVGYGHRVGHIYRYISSAFKEYKDMSKHRSNVSFGADFSYYLKQNVGFGIKYNGIYTSSTADYVFPEIGTVKVTQKTDIHYLGPFIGARYFLMQNRYCIFTNLGGGYVRFRDNINAFNEKAIIARNTAAFFGEVGFDFLITKCLAVGLQVSICIGALEIVSSPINDPIITNSFRENISHVDISLGFRFYK